jgi:hypothetical protein
MEILQGSVGVVLVGGAGWEPLAKLYRCVAWQVEVGLLGAVAVKPVEVVFEFLLVAGQLQKLVLVSSLLHTMKQES